MRLEVTILTKELPNLGALHKSKLGDIVPSLDGRVLVTKMPAP